MQICLRAQVQVVEAMYNVSQPEIGNVPIRGLRLVEHVVAKQLEQETAFRLTPATIALFNNLFASIHKQTFIILSTDCEDGRSLMKPS
jgi:hypothetical protein